MEPKSQEILHITQEECAEVTQAISKVFRFGFTGVHEGKTNKQHLEEELGDLLCMIQLLTEENIVDGVALTRAAYKKKEKLNKWSMYIRTKMEVEQ
jgi:NTP pyrophosphatase (non-canonical NTP hydrolase)